MATVKARILNNSNIRAKQVAIGNTDTVNLSTKSIQELSDVNATETDKGGMAIDDVEGYEDIYEFLRLKLEEVNDRKYLSSSSLSEKEGLILKNQLEENKEKQRMLLDQRFIGEE